MKKLSNIKTKLYYIILKILLFKKVYTLPTYMRDKKNLFLYFDYEREFSGHNTKISNDNIYEIINILKTYKIRSTWFTVGKIFEKYPETIEKILECNSEVASHSYQHIAPKSFSLSELIFDFEQMSSATPIPLKGYHSPQGKWTFSLLKLLRKHSYDYDVIYDKRVKLLRPFYYPFAFEKNVKRLYTVGDDWSLFKSTESSEYAFNHFLELYKKIQIGEVAGIGFHPWVLYSDKSILEGFKKFVKYLYNQEDVNISTAYQYIKQLS
jgi:peptidoglycan/xylan/chitin deacetylase (PgdA/CDA1 family)